ncbi:ABC transporter permease [Caulobacter sp. KR2-114]|uniref:ABC transporter permease n=1 Tax=Caulobacter sp. KR2-114 TaxID=3400912 RepID=UPI003C0D2422
MTPPALLIAEREFRAYASTLSFWVALAIGPLAMAGALGVAALSARAAQPAAIAVAAPDAGLRAAGERALIEAAVLDHVAIEIARRPGAGTPRLVIEADGDGPARARFEGASPLTPAAQVAAARTVERDVALARLGLSPPPTPHARPSAPPSPAAAGGASRFALVMMLWLTLTGSLGMLLQAVVRERANRALESLLAAAGPWDIVLGKLVGVGAVSLLVLAAWLGSAAGLAPLAPSAGGLAGDLLRGLADPATLVRAGLIYLLGFAFYGLVTVGVGARARDSAAAQNLSRPMFAVLLAAFFAAMAAAGGTPGLAWMTFTPPFTPFMLLLQPPGQLPVAAEVGALGLLALSAAAAGGWATRGLRIGAEARGPVSGLFASRARSSRRLQAGC